MMGTVDSQGAVNLNLCGAVTIGGGCSDEGVRPVLSVSRRHSQSRDGPKTNGGTGYD